MREGDLDPVDIGLESTAIHKKNFLALFVNIYIEILNHSQKREQGATISRNRQHELSGWERVEKPLASL